MYAPGLPSPLASRAAIVAETELVKSMASPARSHPSRVVPSGHVTTAWPQECVLGLGAAFALTPASRRMAKRRKGSSASSCPASGSTTRMAGDVGIIAVVAVTVGAPAAR